MKKYILFLLFVFVTLACGVLTASPTPVSVTPILSTSVPPTPIPPTPVGYGVEFPFDPASFQDLGTEVTVTCEQPIKKTMLDPETVRKLVAASGKLDTSLGANNNLTYLWAGNVPLKLFIEPDDNSYEIYYDYWGTSYCVSGLQEDVNDWGAYVTVITKLVPQNFPTNPDPADASVTQHWVTNIDPLEVLKAADMIPFGKSVEVAPSYNDPTQPYDFSSYGEFIVEEVSGHGVWAGKKGEEGLSIVIPADLVDAFLEGGTVEIKGTCYIIEGTGGNTCVATEIIRQE